MEHTRETLFNNFNKFIDEQDVEPYEVCTFIYSLLKEHGYTYVPTRCKVDWVLNDSCENE